MMMSLKVHRVTPRRQGFKPHKMMQAQARGRMYDPQQVASVDVEIIADTRAELHSRAAYDLARDTARQKLHGAHHVSARGIGQRQEGFFRTFTVE